MASLFNLAKEYEELYDALLDSADEETGELDVDISKALETVQGTFKEKASATAIVSRELVNYKEDIDREIKRLQALKKHVERENERVRMYLSEALRAAGIESIKGVYANISFRKSEQTVIDDESQLPEEYVKVKTTYIPDKEAIKKAIKSGVEVTGAHVETVQNLQIK